MQPQNPEARLLVVDDEPNIRELLSTSLRYAGFEVTAAANGREALDAAEEFQPDLAVLDVMLPDMDGFTVTRRLRSAGRHFPVVFLTARDGTEDKITGLTVGGDDYVTKPFSLDEVVARIRAVLRRGNDQASNADAAEGAEAEDEQILSGGRVKMDVERHIVTVAGEPVAMPLKEFDLLEYLLRNAGRVLTRGQLIDRIWGADYVGDTKTLDVHIKRLRTKIEEHPSRPKHLVTVRGLGYKFEL